MPFFALRNLVSSDVSPCEPWKYTGQVPDEYKGKENKKARNAWINSSSTSHQVYSAFEGVNQSRRISEPDAGDEGNPPLWLHAFVADIDIPVSEEELIAGIGRIKYAPNYYEKTPSGHARLIWLFEKPVSFPNRRFAIEFLKVAREGLHPDRIAAGFDAPAWDEPNRYYTNSGEWQSVDSGAYIPFDLLQGYIVQTAEHHKWAKDRGAVDLPLPLVYTELQKKFPTMAWPGDFTLESQGPSFFVPGSESPKSAVVKPTGIYTFSAHAAKPFYSWADLLGQDFIKEHQAKLMGAAVENIWHDGKQYYRTDGHGKWKPFTKEDIIGHLSTDRGLSTRKEGDEPSEVARAIAYIQNWQGIEGAAPFVFQTPGIITKNGNKFLNTHTKRVVNPAGETAIWGDEGNFPFVSRLFDGLFHPHSDPANPLDYWLSWLSRFYRGAYELNLESGQNVFLLGGPGIGKTFLNQGLLPTLFGGSSDAESYLLGKSDFNSDLFESALWTIDDNSATVDVSTHRKFSSMVKKMAANTSFQYHAKFRIPCSVDWLGRVVITANADEQSAAIVPDLSITVLDKLSLFRAAEKPAVDFPSRRECVRIIREESPYLARYLLEYQIPETVIGSNRYGVASYHEKSLTRTAEQSSITAGFAEIVEDWRANYFAEKKDVQKWTGTGFQFLKELHKDSIASAAGLKGYTAQNIGRNLSAIKAKGYGIDVDGSGETRKWTVYRDRGMTELYKQEMGTSENSKFVKHENS